MTYSGFSSFEEASKFIYKKILDNVKPNLIGSKMKLSFTSSQNSKSTYVVLSYKKDFIGLDPLYKACFPLVVRISDHKINNQFSMRDATYTIIVKPKIDRRNIMRVNFIKKEIHKLKNKIYITDDVDKKKEIKNLVFAKQNQINAILGKFEYHFNTSLKVIIEKINNVLKKNKK